MNCTSKLLENFRHKVCSSFKNIVGACLGDMQLFFSCNFDIYSKYVWVVSLKDKEILKLLMFDNKF